jgi:hypothetical protein
MGGNKLVAGPEGWKPGSLVVPRVDGDKVKFQAGFKSAEYPLATGAAASLGPDQFSLTVIGKSGSEDRFVFSTSKASEYVAAFAQNGGRIEEAVGLVEATGTPQAPAATAPTPATNDYVGHGSAVAGPVGASPILADKKSALENYSVIYLGGLPQYPNKKSGSLDFLVTPEAFHLRPTIGSKWFAGLVITYSSVASFDIVERQVTSMEGLLGGINSRQLNQANNIHIEFKADGQDLILRLEMLSGMTVMGQAGKCRELMDRLRVHGVLGRFAGRAVAANPVPPTADIPAQIAKLAALRDQGILTSEEFEAKKTDLLSRL